jgi:hypothetical protein
LIKKKIKLIPLQTLRLAVVTQHLYDDVILQREIEELQERPYNLSKPLLFSQANRSSNEEGKKVCKRTPLERVR